jgi:16S rRNA (uracil1498-N3)-methyltransferase
MKRVNLGRISPQGERIEIVGEAYRHLATVLRVTPGEQIAGTDGQGRSYLVRVDTVGGGSISGTIEAVGEGVGESPLRLTLVQAIPRGGRMEVLVQKAVELGVHRIVALICRHSVVRPSGETERMRRWQRVAAEAVAQCRRSVAPELVGPIDLAGYLTLPASPARIVLHPSPDACTFGDLPEASPGAAEVLVGPEGGLSSEEVVLCRAGGFVPVTLGTRIVRSETAGIAATAILQHRWGDLG